MRIELKEELKTHVSRTDDGYLLITQDGGEKIKLSAAQVKMLLEWLEDGNGLSLEQDWDNGVDQAGD